MNIQQAVFVLGSTEGPASYELAARSDGLTPADAAQIADWLALLGCPLGDREPIIGNLLDGRFVFAKPVQGGAGDLARRPMIAVLVVEQGTYDRLGRDPAAVWAASEPADLVSEAARREVAVQCPDESLVQRADAAHGKSLPEAGRSATALAGPSQEMSGLTDELKEMLEHLDETVFEAIGGDADGLARVEVLWPLVAADLDPDVAEQCREQYLRYAISIWTDFLADDGRDLSRAVAALDVLCLLFEA